MRRLQWTILPLLCLFIFSCQKELDDTLGPVNPGGGGNNGGNTTGSYHPLTAGSWWKFKDSATGTFSTLTATNQTVTRDNILYTVLLSSTGTTTDTALAYAVAPNYKYRMKGLSPNTGAPFDITFHFLNDTASVGYNWTYVAGQGNGFTATIKTSIIEKNISVTVQGKNYNNVIHTKMELSYNIFGVDMDFGSYDYFIAKSVGIVRIRASLGQFGVSFDSCSDLVDSHIQ